MPFSFGEKKINKSPTDVTDLNLQVVSMVTVKIN